MTGLERIKSQILQEADETAKKKLFEAYEEAARIVEEAGLRAQEEAERIQKQTEEEIAIRRERMEQTKELDRREKLLATKQEVIDEILKRAYDAVRKRNAEDYSGLLLGMLKDGVKPWEGVLYLSAEDEKRLSSNFQKRVKKIASEKGGKVEIRMGEREIGHGYVLVYGGIEENRTIEALFEEKRENLADVAQAVLFS